MSIAYSRIITGTDAGPKTVRYQPDRQAQENLLQVNKHLQPVEESHWEYADSLDDPQIVIVAYVPRSGSTLLTQLLARTGEWNYVSNFQARFWLAPYVGGLLEQQIAPRDPATIALESDYGLTRTPSSPAEFSYFWEHWLQFSALGHHELPADRSQELDIVGLRRELRLLGALAPDKPIFFKKEWLGMNSAYLLDQFPTAKVVHITRSDEPVVRSILKARRDVFGDEGHWWGARPATWCELASLTPREQVIGQISAIRAAIDRGAAKYPTRFFSVSYESLAVQPDAVVASVLDWAGA